MDWSDVLAQVAETLREPDRQQRCAERAAARTDPWRWYCRSCGTTGESASRLTRNDEAFGHVADGQPCGHGTHLGMAESGRLLHVWTYGDKVASRQGS